MEQTMREKAKELAAKPGTPRQSWEELCKSENGGDEFLRIMKDIKKWEDQTKRDFNENYKRFAHHLRER